MFKNSFIYNYVETFELTCSPLLHQNPSQQHWTSTANVLVVYDVHFVPKTPFRLAHVPRRVGWVRLVGFVWTHVWSSPTHPHTHTHTTRTCSWLPIYQMVPNCVGAQLALLTPSPLTLNQVRSWRSRGPRNSPKWTSVSRKSPVLPVSLCNTDPPVIHPSPSKTTHTSTLKNKTQWVNTLPYSFTTSFPSYLSTSLFPQPIVISYPQLRRVAPKIITESSITKTKPPARSSWRSFRNFHRRMTMIQLVESALWRRSCHIDISRMWSSIRVQYEPFEENTIRLLKGKDIGAE